MKRTLIIAAAAAGTAALAAGVVLGGTASGAEAGPPVKPVPSDAPSYTAAPPMPDNQASREQLQTLLAKAAAKAGGTMTIAARDSGEDQYTRTGSLVLRYTIARISVPGKGEFELSASVGTQDSVSQQSQWCGLENNTEDGKPCTQLELSEGHGTWSRVYSDQGARVSIDSAATTPSGTTLQLSFTNYVETSSGEKQVGPGWKQVGLDAAALRAILDTSGLLA